MDVSNRSAKEQLLISSLDHRGLLQTDPEDSEPTTTTTTTPADSATPSPPSSTDEEPGSHHLPHPTPEPAVVSCDLLSDQAYMQAAAIFQKLRVDQPISQQLLPYGKKPDTAPEIPESPDKITEKQAYQLAFNTLKYQGLLEDVIIDSRFHTSQQISADLLPLAMVMLFDFQDRKFLVRKLPAQKGKEFHHQEVTNLHGCLHRCKTRLAASLARCRVKQGLRSVSCVLSEAVRTKQHRARLLPLYAWVNTLRSSVEDVSETLRGHGVREVECVTELKECTFCIDPLCPDTLVLSRQAHTLPQLNKLTASLVLNMQDRTVCLAVNALRALLSENSDLMVAGSFSVLTVAHIAALSAARRPEGGGKVLVCGGDLTAPRTEELQELLTRMDLMKNVRVLSEQFRGLDEFSGAVHRMNLIILLPQCSCSALSDPVHTILTEHGDRDLLRDLCEGPVSSSRTRTLAAQQARLLKHALKFPKVKTVVYCTRSVYPEENEKLVKTVLAKVDTHSKLLPFRVNGPVLAEGSGSGPVGDKTTDKFFRIEPSEHTNGCFIARLVREANAIKTETVQEVLARAAAKGLLDGIVSEKPKISTKATKKGRGGKRETATAAGESLSKAVIGQDAERKKSTVGSDNKVSKGARDPEKGDDEVGKGETGRRLLRDEVKSKRPLNKSRRTSVVTKARPHRFRKKPGYGKSTPTPRKPLNPPGQTRAKAPLSDHSTPATPFPDKDTSDPPTMVSQQPKSVPPTPKTPTIPRRRHKQPPGKRTVSKKAGKPRKEVGKPGSPNKATPMGPRPRPWGLKLKDPVDLAPTRTSSPSLSSLSSESDSCHSFTSGGK